MDKECPKSPFGKHYGHGSMLGESKKCMYCGIKDYQLKADNETVRCPFCVDGSWYKDPKWREPYGYPYTPPKIDCGVCHGTKAILKTEIQNHPDKEQITQSEREEIIKNMGKKLEKVKQTKSDKPVVEWNEDGSIK